MALEFSVTEEGRILATDTSLPKVFELEYSYFIYNIRLAESEGYEECPTCFGVDEDTYIESYIGR